MAIKKIMDKNSKGRNRCIRCGARFLSRIEEGRIVKCRKCGCGHLVHFTENGNLIFTDIDRKYLFEKENNDEQ